MVFFYLVTTGWILDISYDNVRIQSIKINQSIIDQSERDTKETIQIKMNK